MLCIIHMMFILVIAYDGNWYIPFKVDIILLYFYTFITAFYSPSCYQCPKCHDTRYMVVDDNDGDDIDGDKEETTVRQLEFLWAHTSQLYHS